MPSGFTHTRQNCCRALVRRFALPRRRRRCDRAPGERARRAASACRPRLSAVMLVSTVANAEASAGSSASPPGSPSPERIAIGDRDGQHPTWPPHGSIPRTTGHDRFGHECREFGIIVPHELELGGRFGLGRPCRPTATRALVVAPRRVRDRLQQSLAFAWPVALSEPLEPEGDLRPSHNLGSCERLMLARPRAAAR